MCGSCDNTPFPHWLSCSLVLLIWPKAPMTKFKSSCRRRLLPPIYSPCFKHAPELPRLTSWACGDGVTFFTDSCLSLDHVLLCQTVSAVPLCAQDLRCRVGSLIYGQLWENICSPQNSTVRVSSASPLPSVPAELEAKVDHPPCVMGAETFHIISLFSCSSSQTTSLGTGHPK